MNRVTLQSNDNAPLPFFETKSVLILVPYPARAASRPTIVGNESGEALRLLAVT